MASKKKLLQAAAGSAGGAGLDVDEVFSTYLYDGNGSSQTITNNIDLSGEGGLVWFKNRTTSNTYHALYDTERGTEKYLMTNVTSAEQTFLNNGVTSFNSNGFTVAGTSDWFNASGEDIVSWTFRKAPKFFDVVTYTGTGVSGLTINHSLGVEPAVVMLKNTTTGGTDWFVFTDVDGSMGYLKLNLTNAKNAASWFTKNTTSFTINTTGTSVNASGQTYVAYLFAHNDGDGEFGPDSDQDVIKCGSYTGNGSTSGPEINLGFEPQWVLIKAAANVRSDTSNYNNWAMFDTMRGMGVVSTNDALAANLSDSEGGGYLSGSFGVSPTPTGFKITTNESLVNYNNTTYIYIAIRRGPLAEPTSATDVYAGAIDGTNNSTSFVTPFTGPDFVFAGNSSTDKWYVASRLTGGGRLNFADQSVETAQNAAYALQFDGAMKDYWSNYYGWVFKRAPSFFDVVAYSGNSTSGRTVSHNLGVAPEMIWVKDRDRSVYWSVFHKDLGSSKRIKLNENAAADSSTGEWNAVDPTSTEFTVGINTSVNYSGDNYIAYLFATLAGVSKVGSYTGTGSTLNIDCGFSSGARFVLIKRTDSAENWILFDSVRGIVAGVDPLLELDTTDAEVSTSDYIDPYSSGFTLTDESSPNGKLNTSGASYIFYAIA